MEEMEDEALSYERGEEEEETTHSVCTRQLMDDVNRLKCSKTSTEEVKEVPFDDQINVEGGWRSRESRRASWVCRRRLRAFRRQEDDETVKMKWV